MNSHLSTTPFGRGGLSLAHLASQIASKARPPEKAVQKWNVFRDICTAKARLGLPERALSVLNALLSFHPETVLTGENLIVFPSNQSLAMRAHGMAPATLRRHLAALVDRGLIIRRDSPNGKRYARKGRGGDLALAFGFDLGPLVARAEEFEAKADEVREEERAVKLARERITLCRRDIAKLIATGIEEGVAVTSGANGPRDWLGFYTLFRSILARVPRTPTLGELEPIGEELSSLADEIVTLLEHHIKSKNLSGNESHGEHHIQNSNPESPIDLEPASQESRGQGTEPKPATPSTPQTAFPLGMVLDACPDIADYARGGLANWRDLIAAAAIVRPMLGVSPSAFEDAQQAMGERQAAIVLAAILQRGPAIASPGGYLRDLTHKAKAGAFSPGPMLMALIGNRKKARAERMSA